jgi:hypothetical protein
MADTQKVFFLHIRKTAGTSIRSVLEKQFDAGQRCPIRSELELRLKVSDQSDWKTYLTTYRFVGGHYYRIAPLLMEEGYKVVTILRDPLDRAISAYNHVKNDKRDPLHKIAVELSFREAIAEPKLAIEFRNSLARYLVGNAGHDFNKLTPEQKVDAALDFLNRIDFFGFQELINHAGKQIGRYLGMNSIAEVPRLNQEVTANGVNRHEVIKDIPIFEANNTIDREIYSRALRVYDQRFG